MVDSFCLESINVFSKFFLEGTQIQFMAPCTRLLVRKLPIAFRYCRWLQQIFLFVVAYGSAHSGCIDLKRLKRVWLAGLAQVLSRELHPQSCRR